MTRQLLLYDYPSSICCQMVRLTLVEKNLDFTTRTVDIVETHEQFEPWYLKLNPRGVVPTLVIGDEIVTNTIEIVQRADREHGPSMTPDDVTQRSEMRDWMHRIMGIHYGVLLYAETVDAQGRSETISTRGQMLRNRWTRYPEHRQALEKRIQGNERLQATLADKVQVARVEQSVRDLLHALDQALKQRPFVAAETYSLADTFATAALARFDLHGYSAHWQASALPSVAKYYQRVKIRSSWARAGVVNRDSPEAKLRSSHGSQELGQ